MHIWLDADSCPLAIKKILFKAVARTGVQLTMVANHPMPVPAHERIRFERVAAGPDMADRQILKKMVYGDLVITADIPLAAQVIKNGGQVLSPYGELFSQENIGARLSVRNFMEALRSAGIKTDGPKPLGQKEKAAFANQLQRILAE